MPHELRSVGVAALLSVVWLGAGHLYAGRTDVGAALVGYNAVLVLMSVTLIGLIFAVPMWLLSAPLVAVLAARAVAEDNRRLRAVAASRPATAP
jgi:TM2 domain-containing membrane protein YozV